ncbi:hypothetical protein GUITHDRAFT_98935 [Guillardia theta CCMP2712]|uniref:Uncharacterized protein n=1 Tax=Guillardia theta (strain CCMP2712) TaxID=905079 RepID=L1K460_GUITC|nr:hypothetical protein GUITHDRAFT_98935 [Guillardia theta CCMP2712]EKX55153.1 hypothetical protein GUITHDRAFT_98935 [Guillardia theta CCMP2712]|eukprot:XP_005842133.1 hypothetical protein GUITHDRAFT_98935 [Guillardia theta CCMP2712]
MLLIVALSLDNACVVVPAAPVPTVTTAPAEAPLADAALQVTAVSDCQVDSGMLVAPTRPLDDKSIRPRPDPQIVTCIDPDPAVFILSAAVSVTLSLDTAPVKDPPCPPVVTDARRLEPVLADAKHTTLVSPTQSVAEQADACIRPTDDACPLPSPAQCRVTLALPVLALLPGSAVLMVARSVEYMAVLLAAVSSIVKVTCALEPLDCPALQMTAESDSHSDPSHELCPARTVGLLSELPSCPPTTVTCADPVAAWFDLPSHELTAPSSHDSCSVTLPTDPTDVKETW